MTMGYIRRYSMCKNFGNEHSAKQLGDFLNDMRSNDNAKNIESK